MLNIEDYIGIPYSARHMDCGDLVIKVQKEMFGKDISLPGKRVRPLEGGLQSEAIALYFEELAEKVETPEEGDAILMREIGSAYAGHVGTYFFVAHAPHVLHTSEVVGGSRLHNLHDLPRYGLVIEGYYRWKPRSTA